MVLDLSALDRVLDQHYRAATVRMLEDLNRPLWWYGPQPDSSRRGWPKRYVLFPRMEAIRQQGLRARRWCRDNLRPALRVLRHGLPERD